MESHHEHMQPSNLSESQETLFELLDLFLSIVPLSMVLCDENYRHISNLECSSLFYHFVLFCTDFSVAAWKMTMEKQSNYETDLICFPYLNGSVFTFVV